jgi:hypothetical protein
VEAQQGGTGGLRAVLFGGRCSNCTQSERTVVNAPTSTSTPQSVTLHTNLGDLKIELFCEQVSVQAQLLGTREPRERGRSAHHSLKTPSDTPAACPFQHQTPRASENFLALCASNYYDGVIFHRNIKGFSEWPDWQWGGPAPQLLKHEGAMKDTRASHPTPTPSLNPTLSSIPPQ